MISYFGEYGADELDIEETRARLEEALGITFVAHDSSFWNGLYYLWEDAAGQSIRIADNREGEPEGILHPSRLPAITVVLTSTGEPSTGIREGLAAVDGLHLAESVRHDSSIVHPKLGYDMYGSASLDPASVRAGVGALLGLAFVPLVDDDYAGECYQAPGQDGEIVSIYDNRDPDPDLRASYHHPEMMTIMNVDGTDRWAALRTLLAGIDGLVHLNHGER